MSQSAPALAVIIPAFNEATVIGATVDAIRAFLGSADLTWEIRVVDDGSTDETCAMVTRLAATDSRVVLQREPHRGKGGAVRAGMLASTAERRFLCDADLSMPVAELPRFLKAVPDACDIAIGQREGAGARRIGEPEHRHTMGRVFNRVVRTLALTHSDDTQCGFKMFSGLAATAVFSRTRLDGWAFDVEALFIAHRLGYRVRPIPIEWHFREQSRVRPVRDAVLMLRDVVTIRLNAWAGVYGRVGWWAPRGSNPGHPD